MYCIPGYVLFKMGVLSPDGTNKMSIVFTTKWFRVCTTVRLRGDLLINVVVAHKTDTFHGKLQDMVWHMSKANSQAKLYILTMTCLLPV